MDLKIAIVSLWAEDVPAVVHFYRDVMGLRPLPHHGPQPAFDLGDIYLTIVQGQPVPAQDQFPVVTFTVPDLYAAVERLRERQVELPWGVEGEKAGRWVMFYDPTGNLLELSSREGLCTELTTRDQPDNDKCISLVL